MSKIPKQLYVVAQATVDQVDPVTGQITYHKNPLGFIHAHEPGKTADDKRKSTQHGWAYSGKKIYKVGDDWWWSGADWDYKTRTRIPFDSPIPAGLEPQIWDNDPIEGFKVMKTVSRYSTSNKLWRILDPRGCQFEISTQSFEDIVMNGTIINGEIQGKCVWVSNKNLVRL